MTTSSPRSRGPFSAARRSWDVGHISRALDATPAFVHHPSFGQGLRYGLGEHDALRVELFPPTTARHAGIACFSTADLDLVLFRQAMPAIAEDGLLFRTGNHLLAIRPSGTLNLYRAVAA